MGWRVHCSIRADTEDDNGSDAQGKNERQTDERQSADPATHPYSSSTAVAEAVLGRPSGRANSHLRAVF